MPAKVVSAQVVLHELTDVVTNTLLIRSCCHHHVSQTPKEKQTHSRYDTAPHYQVSFSEVLIILVHECSMPRRGRVVFYHPFNFSFGVQAPSYPNYSSTHDHVYTRPSRYDGIQKFRSCTVSSRRMRLSSAPVIM